MVNELPKKHNVRVKECKLLVDCCDFFPPGDERRVFCFASLCFKRISWIIFNHVDLFDNMPEAGQAEDILGMWGNPQCGADYCVHHRCSKCYNAPKSTLACWCPLCHLSLFLKLNELLLELWRVFVGLLHNSIFRVVTAASSDLIQWAPWEGCGYLKYSEMFWLYHASTLSVLSQYSFNSHFLRKTFFLPFVWSSSW